MATKPVLLPSIVALALLAGCSDAPPSGDLAASTMPLAIDGDATIDYRAAEYPAGQVPEVGDQLCPPPQAPPQLPQCVPAQSSFAVHFMALPQPDSNGYHVYAVGSAGERDLGALVADANNMWEVAVNYSEDLTGQYERVELRMGTFVLGTAAAGEGTNAFAVAEALTGIAATGSYRGRVLNVTVTGLPEGGSYTGRLYTLDEESGLLTPGEFFPVTPGSPTEYEAEMDIADHAEFHVHVGTSAVNLVNAHIPQ